MRFALDTCTQLILHISLSRSEAQIKTKRKAKRNTKTNKHFSGFVILFFLAFRFNQQFVMHLSMSNNEERNWYLPLFFVFVFTFVACFVSQTRFLGRLSVEGQI